MIKIYNTQSINPITAVMPTKVISSRKKKEDKNKKNKKSDEGKFLNILTSEMDKTQKVLRR